MAQKINLNAKPLFLPKGTTVYKVIKKNKLHLNKIAVELNKEIIYQDTDAKRRLAYEKVRYAPLPGAPPPPPEEYAGDGPAVPPLLP